MNILNGITYCAFAAAIVAVPFLLVNWWKYIMNQPLNRLVTVRSGFPTKSVSFFLISACTAMATASIMTSYARRDALKFLQSLPQGYSVYVNGQQVADPDKMILSLQQVAPYWAHHSHPTTRIRVAVHSNERNLTLDLGRDSDNPKEYWVFYTEHSVTSNNEIGRITTSAFDEY
ncbi:MAG TPA: hypothetical protein VLB68_27355 [Pyrinomonadaceae bacterium]|nr:hypothetical protein [Pyrinomonadaceae bacterium]